MSLCHSFSLYKLIHTELHDVHLDFSVKDYVVADLVSSADAN